METRSCVDSNCSKHPVNLYHCNRLINQVNRYTKNVVAYATHVSFSVFLSLKYERKLKRSCTDKAKLTFRICSIVNVCQLIRLTSMYTDIEFYKF